jgi:cytochrome c55X
MTREGARPTPGRGVAAMALAAAVVLAGWTGAALAQGPDADRQAALLDLVHNTCTTCHGTSLLGDVGPPITPAALKDKDAAMLAATILNGRPGTQMPAFTGMITESEAAWLVGRLKAGLDH